MRWSNSCRRPFFCEKTMSTSKRKSSPPHQPRETVGLAAFGSCGGWDIAIDESTSVADRWYAQIEGPSLYLYFRLVSLDVIGRVLRFLESPSIQSTEPTGVIEVGTFNEALVLLRQDDEFSDRYFFRIGESSPAVRFTIAGDDIKSFTTALLQVSDDLNQDK